MTGTLSTAALDVVTVLLRAIPRDEPTSLRSSSRRLAAEEGWLRRRRFALVVLSLIALAFPGAERAASAQRLLPGPERNTLAPEPNGLGSKKVAVLLFNFADNPGDRPITREAARGRIFTDSDSANAFIRTVSFNQLQITGHFATNGDVFGWYTLPLRGLPNDKDTPSRVLEINARAQVDGFTANNYQVILYVHPASVGDPGWGGQAFGAVRGGKEVELWGVNPAVAAHEIFHILGLDHANGLQCTLNGSPVAVSNNCTSVGYGDPFDSQGGSGFRHPNAYFKARMGWMMTHNFLTVPRDSRQTYTYRLKPLERASTDLLTVRIPIPRNRIPLQFGWGADPSTVDLFYYLEYRQPSLFDGYLFTDPVVNGVSIRLGTDIDTNYMTLLVDTQPDTSTFDDAPLTTGRTFADAFSGVTVRTLTVSAAEATVEVTVEALPDPRSGNLLWYRHRGWQDGVGGWWAGSGNRVGNSWLGFRSVFATSDGVIYGILPNGDLLWYSHLGWDDGVGGWAANGAGRLVGVGWQVFQRVFATSDGVIYGILPNGDLLWYKHEGWRDGVSRWASGSGRRVGNTWQNFVFVTATSEGVIYGVQPNGDLLWHKHAGWQDGVSGWATASGKRVGNSWHTFRSIFATSDGVIYGIQPSGALLWFKHVGWETSVGGWASESGKQVGNSWNGFRSVFATSEGVVYGILP